MKVLFLGAGFQGKTWLMKVAQTGEVPTVANRTSAAEENIRVYLLPAEGKLDAAPQYSGAKNAVICHVWNIPGQNWKSYEANSGFFRLADAGILIVEAQFFDAPDDELGAAAGSALSPVSIAASLGAAARRHVPGIPLFLCLTKCDQLRGYSRGRSQLNPADAKIRTENARLFANAEKFVADHKLMPVIISTSAADKNGMSSLFSIAYDEHQRRLAERSAPASPDKQEPAHRRVDLVLPHEDVKRTGNTCCMSGGANGGNPSSK